MPHATRHESRSELLATSQAVFILDRQGYVIALHEGGKWFRACRPHELLGKHYASLYARPHDNQLLDAALNAEGTGLQARLETWLARRKGGRLRVELCMRVLKGENGQIHGFAMTVRDAGSSRRVHQRLRETERRLRLFVNGVTDYAICMLDPRGYVVDWNAGIQRMTGFKSTEMIGRPFFSLLRGREPSSSPASRLLQQARRTGRAGTVCELICADGQRIPAEIAIEAIHESDGTLLGFAQIIHDRTQQQLAERRLHEARGQIIHAQKIEAIGQLAGGIAHDFNNALQGIISSLELASLCLDGAHARQAKRHVMVSLDAALRAGRLTQRLLSLARRQTAGSQRATVGDVLRSMRELLERTLGDDIVLDVSYPEDLPPLACDSAQLESALVNLAVNARDAMGGHGRLVMTSRLCDLADSAVTMRLDPSRTYVEIAVIDNGPGMNEETRRRAFEPFFTTKPEGRGTGLGLSMVYSFVTEFGGTVDLRSMPGAGTSVLLYLPCDETVPHAPSLKTTKPPPDLTGCYVLVAEDNETIRHAVATRFRQLGCQVFEAASGSEAFAMLANNPSWDLLLTDIDLPMMDGYTLCLEARKHFPELRVILMTGYADAERLDLDGLGITTETLLKPFDMGDLLTKAQLLLQTVPSHSH